jgi:hypothetical protein
VQIQNDPAKLHKDLDLLAKKTGVIVHSIESGYTEGINLGSPSIKTLRKPEILLVVEEGVSAYEAGEVWHLLDYRYEIPVSMVPERVIRKIDLEKYTTIIMVSGSYSSFPSEKIKQWISKGGTLIAIRNALRWVENNSIVHLELKKMEKDTNDVELLYETLERRRGAQLISGAIFENRLDLTHPISYGFHKEILPVFRNSKIILKKSSNPYTHPLMYTDDPLMAGYISKENYNQIINAPGIGVYPFGRGRIIGYSDNPNFRSFWLGTSKLLINGIFFSDLIQVR